MKKLYLITGATGHVGNILVEELKKRHEDIRALVLPEQRTNVPKDVEICFGDITERKSLLPFFHREGYDTLTLIHCAAYVTVASKENPAVWDINVKGTKNIMEMALSHGIERVIYISSVHAIPERPFPEVITEVGTFSPDLVYGQYAKSKAAAAQVVMEYAGRGLNVSIVHPSGIIGPGDRLLKNHMIRTIKAMKSGRLSIAIQGGYDFVDSRDVVRGILLCEEYGRAGECYILSGHYITELELLNTVREFVGRRRTTVAVPYRMVKRIASAAERISLLLCKGVPLITPYSIRTLHTNGLFSYEKARREFGYRPRAFRESIKASL